MNTMKLLLFAMAALFLLGCNSEKTREAFDADLSTSIRINQLGYLPLQVKKFTLADSGAASFQVFRIDGKRVLKGKLQEHGVWNASMEKTWSGDFSKLEEEGSYFINVPGVGRSYVFSIYNNIYKDAAVDALRTFYYQRVSMPMDEKYLGTFARPGGHPDDTCWFHRSSGRSEGFISSPGGWYDAGDYGKYVVNAGISIGTMLAFHELFPDYYADGSLNIPESGNGVNDLLDEIKYEIDWLLTMQDEDGGVFHKLTPLYHDGITMPADTKSKRFIIGKSTSATLDFAALLAQYARLTSDINNGYAEQCIEAAKHAWDWAIANPEAYFTNPAGVGTGQYNDTILDEEFFWAAAELFCTTGEEKYYKEIAPELGKHTFRLEESWRNFIDNIGYYSLLASSQVNTADKDKIRKGIIRTADSLCMLSNTNPYDIPISRFVWGSNSDVSNTAIVQMMAWRLTGDAKYLDDAISNIDYLFGRNATGYSFVSGYGSNCSSNFHHRLLMADENKDAFPGFIAGGPNIYMQDYWNLKKQGVFYPDSIPAKAYIDHAGSYASNEICINWNASLVFVLAFLDEVN